MTPSRNLFLLFSVFTILFGWVARVSHAQPVLFIDDPIFDYGPLYREDHSMVGHTFVIQNLGDEPLLIKGVNPSCGCTKAEVSRNEVPPGETADLYAELQFKHQIGGERIRVTLVTNDPAQPSLDLGLKGELIRRWYLFPNQINAGVMSGEDVHTEVVNLTSHHLTEESVKKVIGVTSQNPNLKVKPLNDPQVERKAGYWEVKRMYELTVQAGETLSANALDQVVFKTDDPDRPEILLPVQWIVEGDLTFEPRSVSLIQDRHRRFSGETLRTPTGKVIDLPGDQGRVSILSRSGEKFRILKVELEEPFQVIWNAERNDPVASIEVILQEVEPGYYDQEMVVTTDREEEAPLRIPIHGEIQHRQPLFSAPSTLKHFGPLFADEVPEVSHTFTIRNGGSRDLQLAIAESLGATAQIRDATLPPGAATQLHMRVSFKNQSGELSPSVTVTSNDPQSTRKTFTMRGLVLPRWSFEPALLDFGGVAPGVEETKRLILRQFFNSWESPSKIKERPSSADSIRVETVQSKVQYEKADYGIGETELLIHFVPSGVPGLHTRNLSLEVESENPPPIPTVPMEWTILGDIRTRPSRILLDPTADGSNKRRSFRVYSKEGAPFKISEVVAPDSLKVVGGPSGSEGYRYEVEVSGSATEEVTGDLELTFKTDREDQPYVKVPVTVSNLGVDSLPTTSGDK